MEKYDIHEPTMVADIPSEIQKRIKWTFRARCNYRLMFNDIVWWDGDRWRLRTKREIARPQRLILMQVTHSS